MNRKRDEQGREEMGRGGVYEWEEWIRERALERKTERGKEGKSRIIKERKRQEEEERGRRAERTQEIENRRTEEGERGSGRGRKVESGCGDE